MNISEKEYLMLREEILHLDTIISNTFNFFYAFFAAYLSFALTKQDTIYILISHVAILPIYLIVLGKRIATCKISAYLLVYHEGDIFNWETNQLKFKTSKQPLIFKFIASSHLPFVFASALIFILYVCRTQWCFPLSIYEICKCVFEIVISLLFIVLVIRNRKISVNDYVKEWKNIKETERQLDTSKLS